MSNDDCPFCAAGFPKSNHTPSGRISKPDPKPIDFNLTGKKIRFLTQKEEDERRAARDPYIAQMMEAMGVDTANEVPSIDAQMLTAHNSRFGGFNIHAYQQRIIDDLMNQPALKVMVPVKPSLIPTPETFDELRKLIQHDFADALAMFEPPALTRQPGSITYFSTPSRHGGYGGHADKLHDPFKPYFWDPVPQIVRVPPEALSELTFNLKDTDIPYLRITAPNPGKWTMHYGRPYVYEVQESYLSCVSAEVMAYLRTKEYERFTPQSIMRAMLGSKSNTAMNLLRYEALKPRYFNVGTIGHCDYAPEKQSRLRLPPRRLNSLTINIRNQITGC